MAKRQNNYARLARQFDREAAETVANAREQERAADRASVAAAILAREQRQRRLLAAWDALRAGDTFTPGNFPIIIRRKNTWSVTDTNGINWSIIEVVGLSRADVERLRKAPFIARESEQP